MERMYAEAKTWNPFKGCDFNCSYCKPTFMAQAKRQKHRCIDCYNYTPHYHPERLVKIPSKKIVFVCGNGDISFCDPDYTHRIIHSIVNHNQRCPDKTYYFQSKKPEYFKQFIPCLPSNVILVTTLETNRDQGYAAVSKAPVPSERYQQFLDLNYPRKVVTIEPVMDFDLDVFTNWITNIAPEYVWLGFNSKPGQVQLPEPSEWKLIAFAQALKGAGIQVNGKDLRGLNI
ncbi:MAG: hypothetical protein PF503_20800 [Desulfobacula sp.]|nr:hypothetical protein [Desulfobacula sp.]